MNSQGSLLFPDDAIRALRAVAPAAGNVIDELLGEPLQEVTELRAAIARQLNVVRTVAGESEFVDLGGAERVAALCQRLLDTIDAGTPEIHRRLFQIAARYFGRVDDGDHDYDSPIGFDDDLHIAETVARLTGASALHATSRRRRSPACPPSPDSGPFVYSSASMNSSAEQTRPRAIDVRVTEHELHVDLSDGRSISVPLSWFPRLANATPEDRSVWRLIGGGEGVHWPRLDEDVSVARLLDPVRTPLA